MNTNETTIPPAAREPKIDTSEIRKASFWVAQICVIIATVLGVYLAASQGLRQALAFEDIRSDKNNAYLRISLRTEMANNVAIVNEYIARIEKNDSFSSRKAPLPLQMVVWENMKFSPNTLETPSELLNGNIEFLRVVNAAYNELSTSGISTETGIKRLKAAVEKVEKEVFPKLDGNIQQLRTALEKRDIKL